MKEFCTSSINGSIYVKEISGFITVSIEFTFHVPIHSLRPFERNADRDVKVDYDVILHISESLHAVGSLNVPAKSSISH